MKKSNTSKWYRLMRTMVALLLIMSVLLCGCSKADKNDDDDKKDDSQSQNLFGDGDGKLEAQDAVDSLTNIYGVLLESFGGNKADSAGYEMDLVVTLGDELLSQLGNAMSQMEVNSDMSWFKNLGLHMEMNSNTDAVEMVVDAQLNGEKIVSAELIMDVVGNMLYLSAPELNNQTVGVQQDFSQVQASTQATAQLMEKYAGMIQGLPSDQELNAVLTRYLNVALEGLNKPTTAETELRVGEMTQSVTATTYSITRHNVLDIATAILTTAKTDAELEKLLDAFSKVVNAIGADQAKEQGATWNDVDLHGQLMGEIDPALEDIRETKDYTEDLEFMLFVVYTDGKDQVGFELMMADSGNTVVPLQLYSLKDGKDTAFYLNVMGSVQLTGNGTTSGNKISGSYTLLANGQELLYLQLKNFDTKALQKGELKGTLRLSPSQALMRSLIGSNMRLPEDAAIELELDVTGKKARIECGFYVGDVRSFSISMTSKTTSGGKIKLPGNYVNGNDSAAMSAWAEKLQFNTVLNNLQRAGMPTDLVDLLEQAIQDAMEGGTAVPDYPNQVYPGYN